MEKLLLLCFGDSFKYDTAIMIESKTIGNTFLTLIAFVRLRTIGGAELVNKINNQIKER